MTLSQPVTPSPHYWKGALSIAFVFSAPGAKEVAAGRPVAGDTGDNLNSALRVLAARRPAIFLSVDRYQYRITNSHSAPLAASRGDRYTEPTKTEVLRPENVSRVLSELAGCTLVILCGDRAGWLEKDVRTLGMPTIRVPHVGNIALNRSYRLAPEVRSKRSAERRMQRVACWCDDVLASLDAL